MSISTRHSRPTDRCALESCGDAFPAVDGVKGNYCSKPCYWDDIGAGLLADIHHNHALCGSCFRLRKDIERPPETFLHRRLSTVEYGYTPVGSDSQTLERYSQEVSRDAIIGFAYNRHAEMGAYGLECRCGAVNHDIEYWFLRDNEPWEWYLQLASEYLRDIGARDDALTAADVAQAYWRTGSLERSVGVALEARTNREAVSTKC